MTDLEKAAVTFIEETGIQYEYAKEASVQAVTIPITEYEALLKAVTDAAEQGKIQP